MAEAGPVQISRIQDIPLDKQSVELPVSRVYCSKLTASYVPHELSAAK